MNPLLENRTQLAEQIPEKKYLSMMTGRQIAYTIYACSKINEVQRRGIGMHDPLNIELVNDNLKKFDEVWETYPTDTGEGTRRRSVGGPSPSTIGEVGVHVECLSAISFRSGSQQ